MLKTGITSVPVHDTRLDSIQKELMRHSGHASNNGRQLDYHALSSGNNEGIKFDQGGDLSFSNAKKNKAPLQQPKQPLTLYKSKVPHNPMTQDDEVRIDEAGRFLIDNVQNLESLESSEFYPN